MVVPGVAHARTITRLHTASFLEDPGASLCRLADNPLHREQLEIVRALGPVLAVNTVLDEARRLCFVSFGAIEPSHDQAVAFARARVQIPVERRFPTVVTSAAGHPLDATYYQTVKGMVGALGAVEPGGALFVVSACTEGLGSEPYVRAQRRLVDQGPEAFVAGLLGKDHASVDEWQTEMQARAMRRARIHLVSGGLAPEDRALTGVRCVGSLEEALAREVERSGDPRVAVIPEGPYVVPCGLPQR